MVTAAVAAIAACAGAPATGEVRHANGAVAQAGPLVDGLQEGEWTFWYPNGVCKARGSYAKDERTGLWTHWHEDGSLQMRGEYRDERQQGLWEYWYPGGRPLCRGAFRDGREHGEWQFWHENGALAQRGCFASGKRQLEWCEWAADSTVVSLGSYLDDVPAGRWSRVGPDGASREVDYPLPSGVEFVRETWDGIRVRREGWLRGGVRDGLWISRHRSGAVRASLVFERGAPSGPLEIHCADGTILGRGDVADGRTCGTWSVRGADGAWTAAAADLPRAPWDRTWSDDAMPEKEPPLATAQRWLDELCAPRDVAPVPVAAPAAAGPAAAPPRLEAPTDPGEWTVRERAELELFRRYFRDGWLPRRQSAGARYGAPSGSVRLGDGDAGLAATIVGKPLPRTRFPTSTGDVLDLASLRGKRVLLVVLRGFTSQVCVYCFAQTAELAPLAPRWAELDCEVVVLFPGSRSRLEAFAAACRSEFGDAKPPYRMVYDPDLDLAKALGLEGNLARPAAFVLGRDGVVQHAYVAEDVVNVADRPAATELLRWVGATP